MISTLFSNSFVLVLIILQLIGPYIFEFLNISDMGILVSAEYLFLLIPSIIYIIFTKQNFKTSLSIRPINIKTILLLLSLTLLIQPSMGLLAAISSLVFPNDVSEFIIGLNNIPLPLAMFILAVTPAICEEVAFRGAFASGYRNVDIKKAAIMNGLMFAFLHLNGQQFLYAFVMGIVFTYIVYITGSIFSSMFIHFIFNGSQLMLARMATSSMDTANTQVAIGVLGASETTLLYIVIGVYAFLTIITIPLIYLIFKLLIKINSNKKDDIILEKGYENLSDCKIIAKISSPYKEKVVNWPVIVITIIYILIVLSPFLF